MSLTLRTPSTTLSCVRSLSRAARQFNGPTLREWPQLRRQPPQSWWCAPADALARQIHRVRSQRWNRYRRSRRAALRAAPRDRAVRLVLTCGAWNLLRHGGRCDRERRAREESSSRRNLRPPRDSTRASALRRQEVRLLAGRKRAMVRGHRWRTRPDRRHHLGSLATAPHDGPLDGRGDDQVCECSRVLRTLRRVG